MHTISCCYDASVRTTVTLDPDVATRLRRLAAQRGASFKETINATLRAGLEAGRTAGHPYEEQTVDLGVLPGIDLTKALRLADDLGPMILLHVDLPNLHVEDVESLVGALPSDDGPGVTIAPDRAGTGTNGLVLRPPGQQHLVLGAQRLAQWGEDFLADGILQLRQVEVGETEVQLRLRCVKMRWMNHDHNALALNHDGERFFVTHIISKKK